MWKDSLYFHLFISFKWFRSTSTYRFIAINAVMHRRVVVTLPGMEPTRVKPFGQVARLSTWPPQARCRATVFPKLLFPSSSSRSDS
jgi:hypothetical protein